MSHDSRVTRVSMLVYFGFQCDTRRLIQERCAARETGSRHSCVQDVERSTYKCCLFQHCFLILVAGFIPKPGPKVHHIHHNILPLLFPTASLLPPPSACTAHYPPRPERHRFIPGRDMAKAKAKAASPAPLVAKMPSRRLSSIPRSPPPPLSACSAAALRALGRLLQGSAAPPQAPPPSGPSPPPPHSAAAALHIRRHLRPPLPPPPPQPLPISAAAPLCDRRQAAASPRRPP